jgi:hypothetical protein
VNRVIYSRTVSYPDKENSPRLMVWIGLTEENNGFSSPGTLRMQGPEQTTVGPGAAG